MDFFKEKENKIIKKFLKDGYIIGNVESKKSIRIIKEIVEKYLKFKDPGKKKINLNNFHKFQDISTLNDTRLKIISEINRNNKIRLEYFNLAREYLYTLVGNELMMQKKLNLSIQIPNDSSSLLPIHSDVWSGDSSFEINLWVPLVDCYRTKSMYILKQKNLNYFQKKMGERNIKSSSQIYNTIKNKVEWLNVKYGQFLIFNQTLPHGNVVNKEKETRWSLNCRFKSIFSHYGDKKIGEFFLPITTRPMTNIGINYRYPFKDK